MSADQLYQRMLCSAAEVSMSRALSGGFKQDDWTAVWAARKALDAAEIFVDDSSLITPAEILSKCRRLKREKGLDVVLIDYLQLMYSGTRTDNRQSEIAEITRRLKIAAKELEVPVILLSQMSREVEKRTGHKPQLSDLRESGAIEQDADIVIFIHRDKKEGDKQNEGSQPQPPPEPTNAPTVVELHIAKHRNGKTGVIKLAWNGETVTFSDYVEDKTNL
jgi:replicative DNA helicase